MVKHSLQRGCGRHATQFAVGVGEQMWIGQV
jgi:hypothetical protein